MSVVNKPKAIGTSAETAVVRWLQINGYPHARRKVLAGAKDEGDIQVGPELIIEVKSYAGGPAIGQPSQKQLAGWMTELDIEMAHSASTFGALVVRRKGTTNAGDWWAYVTYGQLSVIMGGPDRMEGSPTIVCLSLANLANLWRTNGIGLS